MHGAARRTRRTQHRATGPQGHKECSASDAAISWAGSWRGAPPPGAARAARTGLCGSDGGWGGRGGEGGTGNQAQGTRGGSQQQQTHGTEGRALAVDDRRAASEADADADADRLASPGTIPYQRALAPARFLLSSFEDGAPSHVATRDWKTSVCRTSKHTADIMITMHQPWRIPTPCADQAGTDAYSQRIRGVRSVGVVLARPRVRYCFYCFKRVIVGINVSRHMCLSCWI